MSIDEFDVEDFVNGMDATMDFDDTEDFLSSCDSLEDALEQLLQSEAYKEAEQERKKDI